MYCDLLRSTGEKMLKIVADVLQEYKKKNIIKWPTLLNKCTRHPFLAEDTQIQFLHILKMQSFEAGGD